MRIPAKYLVIGSVVVVVAMAVVGVLEIGGHAGHKVSPATPPTSTSGPTTSYPVAPAPTMRYADVAMSDAAAYAADAWCNPLQDASGHSLEALENDVTSSTEELAGSSTPAMAQALAPALGQVVPSPEARSAALIDLATASAIVPVGVNPSAVVLHTAYCYSALQPLTGYQVTAQGGVDDIDLEAACSLTTEGHTTWWHLWWQPTLSFGPCGQSVCLSNWETSGTHVTYWAAEQRSTTPQYVVPAPDGAWRLSYPPS